MSSNKVFVSFYATLGDADGSIDGSKIMDKDEWEKDFQEFQDYLEENEISQVEPEDEHFGIYYVDADCWAVQECSEEEAAVLEKFIGTESGDFRMPTEFIE